MSWPCARSDTLPEDMFNKQITQYLTARASPPQNPLPEGSLSCRAQTRIMSLEYVHSWGWTWPSFPAWLPSCKQQLSRVLCLHRHLLDVSIYILNLWKLHTIVYCIASPAMFLLSMNFMNCSLNEAIHSFFLFLREYLYLTLNAIFISISTGHLLA